MKPREFRKQMVKHLNLPKLKLCLMLAQDSKDNLLGYILTYNQFRFSCKLSVTATVIARLLIHGLSAIDGEVYLRLLKKPTPIFFFARSRISFSISRTFLLRLEALNHSFFGRCMQNFIALHPLNHSSEKSTFLYSSKYGPPTVQ